MFLYEKELDVPSLGWDQSLFRHLEESIRKEFGWNEYPIRFVITNSDGRRLHCEVGLTGLDQSIEINGPPPLFDFRRRMVERSDRFTAALLVPTGIGSEIGGHAGDAGPAAKLLASACDTLITHPNVVNASDINEIPENALYVEGSVITRLFMGTMGLQATRSNRVLVVIDAHKDNLFVNSAVNSVSGARAAYGLRCPKVVKLDPPIRMKTDYSTTGRAIGTVEGLVDLYKLLKRERGNFDAVALSSVIHVPGDFHMDYFLSEGKMVNPWGGVEALLTHAVSSLLDVPSAHSPMFESRDIAEMDPGIVEPRMASEAVSLTFLQCILKGLSRSPRIITNQDAMRAPNTITAEDISCLVIPDGCLGLPTLAALYQGIPVIAVKENRNLMKNDLSVLPWAPDQFTRVENYWEAVGVITAMRAGIDPYSVRRPIKYTKVVEARKTDVEHSSPHAEVVIEKV